MSNSNFFINGSYNSINRGINLPQNNFTNYKNKTLNVRENDILPTDYYFGYEKAQPTKIDRFAFDNNRSLDKTSIYFFKNYQPPSLKMYPEKNYLINIEKKKPTVGTFLFN